MSHGVPAQPVPLVPKLFASGSRPSSASRGRTAVDQTELNHLSSMASTLPNNTNRGGSGSTPARPHSARLFGNNNSSSNAHHHQPNYNNSSADALLTQTQRNLERTLREKHELERNIMKLEAQLLDAEGVIEQQQQQFENRAQTTVVDQRSTPQRQSTAAASSGGSQTTTALPAPSQESSLSEESLQRARGYISSLYEQPTPSTAEELVTFMMERVRDLQLVQNQNEVYEAERGETKTRFTKLSQEWGAAERRMKEQEAQLRSTEVDLQTATLEIVKLQQTAALNGSRSFDSPTSLPTPKKPLEEQLRIGDIIAGVHQSVSLLQSQISGRVGGDPDVEYGGFDEEGDQDGGDEFITAFDELEKELDSDISAATQHEEAFAQQLHLVMSAKATTSKDHTAELKARDEEIHSLKKEMETHLKEHEEGRQKYAMMVEYKLKELGDVIQVKDTQIASLKKEAKESDNEITEKVKAGQAESETAVSEQLQSLQQQYDRLVAGAKETEQAQLEEAEAKEAEQVELNKVLQAKEDALQAKEVELAAIRADQAESETEAGKQLKSLQQQYDELAAEFKETQQTQLAEVESREVEKRKMELAILTELEEGRKARQVLEAEEMETLRQSARCMEAMLGSELYVGLTDNAETATSEDDEEDTAETDLTAKQIFAQTRAQLEAFALELTRKLQRGGEQQQTQWGSSTSRVNDLPDVSPIKSLVDFPAIVPLHDLENWAFDTCRATEGIAGGPLYQVGLQIAKKMGFLGALVDEAVWQRWLLALQSGYRDVPYHNATHAADITVALFVILKQTGVYEEMTPVERLAAIAAACGHDFQHPGVSNLFLSNVRDPVALRHNDVSVLENHHVSASFDLMAQPELDITAQLSPSDTERFRAVFIGAVLGTDMSNHFKHLAEFERRTVDQPYDLADPQDRLEVIRQLLHTADLSNSAKIFQISEQWAERITEEFQNQGAVEEEVGLPHIPTTVPGAPMVPGQVGFLDFIIIRMFTALAYAFPPMQLQLDLVIENRNIWAERCDKPSRERIDASAAVLPGAAPKPAPVTAATTVDTEEVVALQSLLLEHQELCKQLAEENIALMAKSTGYAIMLAEEEEDEGEEEEGDDDGEETPQLEESHPVMNGGFDSSSDDDNF